jgi:hypothetical protein
MNKGDLVLQARTGKRHDKDRTIENYCKDKTVLDVGCIGQDRNFKEPNWLHNKVKGWSKEVDGVDILIEQINELKRNGYNMYSIQELQALKKTYEVVLMADVIEHVDNPVDFLKFYASFLADTGVMVISTPNANRANNFINILFNNNYSVNPEHTCWYCPKTFSEVVSRTGLELRSFYWIDHYYNSSSVRGLYQKVKFHLANFLIARRSNFSPNMIFILSKP